MNHLLQCWSEAFISFI